MASGLIPSPHGVDLRGSVSGHIFQLLDESFGLGHLFRRVGPTEFPAHFALRQAGLGVFVAGSVGIGHFLTLGELLTGVIGLALQGHNETRLAKCWGAASQRALGDLQGSLAGGPRSAA